MGAGGGWIRACKLAQRLGLYCCVFTAVAVVDGAGGGHVEGVELAVVDVRGAVAFHPRLGLKAVGAGIADVEGHGLEDGEHSENKTSTLFELKTKRNFVCCGVWWAS